MSEAPNPDTKPRRTQEEIEADLRVAGPRWLKSGSSKDEATVNKLLDEWLDTSKAEVTT